MGVPMVGLQMQLRDEEKLSMEFLAVGTTILLDVTKLQIASFLLQWKSTSTSRPWLICL